MTIADLPRSSESSRKVWVTADEHYCDPKIIGYTRRPYDDVDAMRDDLIVRHNTLVAPEDHVIHVGDFCTGTRRDFCDLVAALNGTHYFMEGDHDWALLSYLKWDDKPPEIEARVVVLPEMVRLTFNGTVVTLCHYAMLRWRNGHFGAPHLFAHSHGGLMHLSAAIDIGVDSNSYNPWLLVDAMEKASSKFTKNK